ncbi:MAG: ArnT family glycosyltransferase [Candidatus Acidiferrales bacterium]
MNPRLISFKQLAAAMLVGLVLRMFFILHHPFYSGDTKFYEELARNWLDHGVYGIFVRGQLLPVDMRMPGYPAFLAGIYAVLGRTRMAVMLAQAVLDLATCYVIAMIAARLAPAAKRRVAATAALWLAVICPFTAGYTAAILTETLATFFTALAFYALLRAVTDPAYELSRESFRREAVFSFVGWILLGGGLAGLGTLVRPETPLILAAAGLVLCIRWRHYRDWEKLALAGTWMAVGLLIPLLPWAARNARTLGRIEFLAPHYAESRGDYIPRGFYAWTGSWMVRPRDAYLAIWKLGKEPIPSDSLPDAAFDSDTEHARVDTWLGRYNTDLKMTPLLDNDFAKLARERTRRKPWRTFLLIPLARAGAMWFTPHVELLPYSGELWPPGERWRSNRIDFSVTLGLGILNIILLGMVLVGALHCSNRQGLALALAFLGIRTAFFTQVHTIEPRYMIVCFPLLFAMGAQAWAYSRVRVAGEGVTVAREAAHA